MSKFQTPIVFLSAATLAGCSGDLSALDPAGPAARSIAHLWWVMLAGASLLFLLVMALLFMVMRRENALRNISMKTWIVGGGLIMPLPVLTVLTGFALYQGEGLIGARDESQPFRVEVRASMWNWEFAYLDVEYDGTTINRLHIPVGRPIELQLTSSDVIHSFWVPRLGGKIDAIPGHVTRLRLEADRPGSYGGVCAEYCGTGHAQMNFRVIAHQQNTLEQAVLEDTP